MNKKEIIKGCLFHLKNKPNCLIEVVKLEDSKVKAIVYDENGSEYDEVDISDLKSISLSITFLKCLGFEEKRGILMGLPDEHYWQKIINNHIIWIVDDAGTLKFATLDADAYHGVKLSQAPYLHELQNIIGSIDAAKLLKDMKSTR